MNYLGGGEHHNSADFSKRNSSSGSRSADPHMASPGEDSLLVGSRPGDVRAFVHKSFIGRFVGGIASKVIGSVPIVGGIGASIFDRLRGAPTVPQATACPPGFISTPQGCAPRPRQQVTFAPVSQPPIFVGARQDGAFAPPTSAQAGLRTELGMAVDPAAGVPVMGRFGAGFEPSIFMTDTRRCGRGAVLGVDGICYNKRDLRNNERFWPRGRRPLLTGGEMRAISTASSAAKKLQRKQKQLEGLGLLKRPASRSRRALPAGHRAQLTHALTGHE